jgi:outer membrane lipoprotein-sorting protein
MGNAPLLSATRDDLIRRINSEAESIQTLKGTVGITASVGGSKRGKVTDYQEIRGYILLRKPSLLRMMGFFPIVQSRVFDMVSNGDLFKLWVPLRNQFIVGNNHEVKPASSPLANMRPQVVLDALLLPVFDEKSGLAVLELGNETVVDPVTRQRSLQADYTLDFLQQNSHGWYLARKISFDRQNLQPYRQIIYDETGSVATDVLYDEYAGFNGSVFPTKIQIWRPQEEYSIKFSIVKLSINGPVSDDQFVLEPPPGARLAMR